MNRITLTFFVLTLLLSLPGCTPDTEKFNAMKWRITLDPEDKGPYGTYLANGSVKYYFPDAKYEPMPKEFHYDNMDNKMKYNGYGQSLIIFVGLDFNVSDDEWKQLKEFVNNGNEIVIFCSQLDDKIEKELFCYKKGGNEGADELYNLAPGLKNQNVLSVPGLGDKRYGYQGRSIKGFFSVAADTSNATVGFRKYDDTMSNGMTLYGPDTLGYANGRPDMLRYQLGTGHITLHAAPLVMSNYFLLQPGNIEYLTFIWQTLPKNITKIYTHNYYKRSGEPSGFDILWKYPSTRWALILGILALLFYILFEGKRKQRIIPIVAPLKNDSVSFVETVGRLYYNKGNHTNLSEKMVQQFLEWVRMHYFLNTNLLNENFIHQLTIKSGQPEATVRGLMDMIHEIKTHSAKMDDAYLYQLYNTIQQFYKNHSK